MRCDMRAGCTRFHAFRFIDIVSNYRKAPRALCLLPFHSPSSRASRARTERMLSTVAPRHTAHRHIAIRAAMAAAPLRAAAPDLSHSPPLSHRRPSPSNICACVHCARVLPLTILAARARSSPPRALLLLLLPLGAHAVATSRVRAASIMEPVTRSWKSRRAVTSTSSAFRCESDTPPICAQYVLL